MPLQLPPRAVVRSPSVLSRPISLSSLLKTLTASRPGVGDPLTLAEEEGGNTPATGAPTVSGIAQVGESLTADTSGIADEDGLTNVSFDYRWLSDDTAIQGATDFTYALVEGDEGKAIKVQVSFSDDGGNEETLTSAPTGPVLTGPVLGRRPAGSAPQSHRHPRKQGDHPVLGPARRQRQRACDEIPHRVEDRRQGLQKGALGPIGKDDLYEDRPGQWS